MISGTPSLRKQLIHLTEEELYGPRFFSKNGFEVTQQQLDEAFAQGWNHFDTNWRNNVQSSIDGVVNAAISRTSH